MRVNITIFVFKDYSIVTYQHTDDEENNKKVINLLIEKSVNNYLLELEVYQPINE